METEEIDSGADITEEIEAEPNEVDKWNIIFDYLFSPVFGWSIVVVIVALILLWNKIQNFFDKIYEKRQQREYDAKCHKDPDWALGHFERMEAARRKMQEQYNVQAVVYQEKIAEREKVKKLEKLTKCTTLEGNRLGHGNNSSQQDYKPLDGNAGGRYKPSKRSTCSGGGCG